MPGKSAARPTADETAITVTPPGEDAEEASAERDGAKPSLPRTRLDAGKGGAYFINVN